MTTYVVYICIYRERYINFSGILAIHPREKVHNLWNISDYYFPTLNDNNSLYNNSIVQSGNKVCKQVA